MVEQADHREIILSVAREQVLSRIRQAIPPTAASSVKAGHAAIPREYQRAGTLGESARLTLFEDRLRDYGAGVYRCAESAIAATVALAMKARGKSELIVPPAVPQAWLPPEARFLPSNALSYADLDQTQGVLTNCVGAVAISGTILLQHTADNGRRAITLIPDYHLCIVFADQVRETLAEGLEALPKNLSVPITTISGPSATSDIEMTRVKGVHGPRVLDVILAARNP